MRRFYRCAYNTFNYRAVCCKVVLNPHFAKNDMNKISIFDRLVATRDSIFSHLWGHSVVKKNIFIILIGSCVVVIEWDADNHNLFKLHCCKVVKNSCSLRGLNPWHRAHKTRALPTELKGLYPHTKIVWCLYILILYIYIIL